MSTRCHVATRKGLFTVERGPGGWTIARAGFEWFSGDGCQVLGVVPKTCKDSRPLDPKRFRLRTLKVGPIADGHHRHDLLAVQVKRQRPLDGYVDLDGRPGLVAPGDAFGQPLVVSGFFLVSAARARNDPADPTRHTRPQPVRVTPAAAPRYTGPVAVLTGGSTVSAGETFVQALIDRPGKAVRIGQPTQGVFSDVLPRRLPISGMGTWLPNEEFLTRSGTTFDGPGIPPHLTEPVFTEEEFEKNRDSAFDKALKILRS
mgnify:CR=1 FL=1